MMRSLTISVAPNRFSKDWAPREVEWFEMVNHLRDCRRTKETVSEYRAMSREAKLYLLDEPIAGVDPAARDFIMNTILTNYSPEGTVLISTHLISDIERVLDEAVFLSGGKAVLHDTVDNIRSERGKSVDALFREIFRMMPLEGGNRYVG